VAQFKSALVFLLQSIVVGLAVAFVVVLVRPDLMPGVANLVQETDAKTDRPRFRIDTAFASAVVLDEEGYLVTNYHVFQDEPTEIRVQFSDGRIAEPEIVGLDAETDLALLKVDVPNLRPIKLAKSNELRIGDVVLAIGNPYGLSTSVTQGIVSATGRNLYQLVTFANFIQTDAAINAGNSGGALVNSLGELVGINTAVLAQDTGTEGIGFAIPVDLVRGVVEQIKLNGRVIRGYMGLLPDDLTNAERMANGVEGDSGIMLMDVYEGGPAAAADLRIGLRTGRVVAVAASYTTRRIDAPSCRSFSSIRSYPRSTW
jgi:serine protease DegS